MVHSFNDGAAYAISDSIPSKHANRTSEPYAVKQYAEGYFYQHMRIDGDVLKYAAYDQDGNVRDVFTISKK